MNYTILTDKEIYLDLRADSHKLEHLTHHFVKIISSGELPYGYKLKSVKEMAQLTGLSIPSIYLVLEALVARKMVTTAKGAVAKVSYIGPIEGPDTTIYVQADSQFKTVRRYTYSLNKYFHKVQEKHRSEHPPSLQNTSYGPLSLTCCNILNEQQGTNFHYNNSCYYHDARLLHFAVVSILSKKSGVVIIPSQSLHLKAILSLKGINFFEVGFDDKGLLVDEVKLLCEQHKISAIYLMSRANFPNMLDTVEERIALLFQLKDRYGFTIIENCGFEPWLKDKENYILKLADNMMEDVIFISPIIHIIEEIGKQIFVIAHAEMICEINKYIALISSYKSYSMAYAIKEVLLSKVYAATIKELEYAVGQVAALIRKIFRTPGFWEPAGIRNEDGTAVYLVPREGYFRTDVYKRILELDILVTDPSSYYEEGTPVLGIRIDVSFLIGMTHAEETLSILDNNFRKLVCVN